MSQVGYMFLALGVGAWSAAIFHFMTHAFFKALLFLAAGVVIQALDNEHDIFRMGGLRRRLPLAFWSFLVGAGSLSALPFVTAGFYSKDMILLGSWSSPTGGPWLWAAGTIGAALTSLYAFRVVLVAFFGEEKAPVRGKAPPLMAMPLIILSVFSLGAGFLEYPRSLGVTSFVDLIRSSMHETAHVPGDSLVGVFLTICTSLASVAGVLAAFLLYRTLPDSTAALERNHICSAFGRFWSSGWGFDRLYDGLFVAPYTWIARLDKNDVVDLFYEGLARGAVVTSRVLSTSQSGLVRWYVMAPAIGAVVFMGIVVFL
jgi:NADH-quinone oxidoreductase subunit L